MPVTNNAKRWHIDCAPGEVGEYVILPGDPKRCAKIAQYFDNPVLVADKREFTTYTGYLNGKKVSVTSTGIGGPSASIAMEELVECGAKTFVRIGTCGGMQLNINSGDVIVATGAIRCDGTSKEYCDIEFPAVPDFEVLSALVESCKKLGVKYHTGIVQNKDSYYGQHRPAALPNGAELLRKWDEWKKMGTIGSEMESSTLFIVAQYLKVRCGSCFLVVANQERAAAGLDNPIVEDTDMAIKVAIEAVKILMANDEKIK